MSEKNPVESYIDEAVSSASGLEWETAWAITETLMEAIEKGGKVVVCGNGGSAADASHFAGELVGRFRRERPGLAAISISSDTSVITAIGNDYGFQHVFERQVEALGVPGDVLVALTTSGMSPNIVKAAEKASEKGMKVVAFTSVSCPKAEWADVHWVAPSEKTSHAQEQMIMALHSICHGLEVLLEQGK